VDLPGFGTGWDTGISARALRLSDHMGLEERSKLHVDMAMPEPHRHITTKRDT
jgi:hypothetical protein